MNDGIPHDAPLSAGLSEREAAERLRNEGPNELPVSNRRSGWRITFEVLKEPMFALMAAAAAVYLVLGDLGEAILLATFAGLSIGIAAVQETRTEHVLEALKNLSSPRAEVLRDGVLRRIPGREVVRGDVILLNEGDRIPADGLLVSDGSVQVDESLLTGESIAVSKRPFADTDQLTATTAGGDALPYLYSGTLVVRGAARAVVTATGPRSTIGHIGRTLTEINPEPPRLKREIGRIVRVFAIFGVSLSVAVAVLYGLSGHAWMESGLSGIAIAMSMLPEEFPLVLTVFTVMGAWRISRVRVLTRRASAIETLGSATTLCTDKTGTLTHNRMAITQIVCPDSSWRAGEMELTQAVSETLALAVLATGPDSYDPMDKAVHESASRLSAPPTAGRRLLRERGLRKDFLAVVNVWTETDSPSLLVAAKGAPEVIAVLCGLSADKQANLFRQVDALASSGIRVLAVACANIPPDDADLDPSALPFRLRGLLGFADPLRATVPQAVAECRSAGIRVIMMTGDYPKTARSIAVEAGIDARVVIVGEDLRVMDDRMLQESLRTTNVFARISPDQKLRIVNALKADGEIVAMTGDGVNDAPSLKAAHIGIAMGKRGTDVAREAASIVLLDDDFSSIVRAIRLGRRIYDNLQRTMCYILAVHVPIAGLAIMPLLFSMPMFLGPPLIAFLEMIIDPTCSIVLEAEKEDANIMRRAPRNPAARILNLRLASWSLVQGLLALATVSAVFLYSIFNLGIPQAEVRSLSFVTLVGANLALVLANRTRSASPQAVFSPSNHLLWIGFGSVLALLCLVLYWQPLQHLFRFVPLNSVSLLIAGIVSAILLGGLLIVKGSMSYGRIGPL